VIYVVGSGPAGVSCAHALLAKGYEVTLLDAGVVLDKDKQKILAILQKKKKWPAELVEKIKCKLDVGAKDGPYKLSYGSDYPYREVQDHIHLDVQGALCRPSFAKGGLSTVWGAAVLPYIDEDIVDWPVKIKKLAPYYRKVLSFMKIAAVKDELVQRFPLYTKKYDTFNPSEQATLLLGHFRKHKTELYEQGFRFGSSRLAVRFAAEESKPGCVYCGLCLYGCPNQLIYSAAGTIDELRKYETFTYVPDVVVDKVVEQKEGVTIVARSRSKKEPCEFSGSHVFIGCGAIPTTKILLASMNAVGKKVTLRDSQQFLVPCFAYKGVRDIVHKKLHTLCQLYVEILDTALDKRHIHAQVYTYNDVYDQWLKKKFGVLCKLLAIPFKFVMGHVVVLKVFLHSDSSGKIDVSLDKSGKLIVRGLPLKSKKTLRAILWKLMCNHRLLGFFPLLPLVKSSKPGGANHYGGSFPMRKRPGMFESDVLGRPRGFKRVHAVDSTVLPAIASQTITFTIMANAYRIGSEFDGVAAGVPEVRVALPIEEKVQGNIYIS